MCFHLSFFVSAGRGAKTLRQRDGEIGCHQRCTCVSGQLSRHEPNRFDFDMKIDLALRVLAAYSKYFRCTTLSAALILEKLRRTPLGFVGTQVAFELAKSNNNSSSLRNNVLGFES